MRSLLNFQADVHIDIDGTTYLIRIVVLIPALKVQSPSLLIKAAADIVLSDDDFISPNPTASIERYAKAAGGGDVYFLSIQG
jgi:hypothetical protein